MKNYNLKYNQYSSYAREHSLDKKVEKIIQRLNVNQDFFICNWKGMKFSIKPFLCSALSFVSSDDVFNRLCQAVVQEDKDIFNKLDSKDSSWYYSGLNEDETNVYNSILYQLGSRVPCLYRYLLTLDNNNVGRIAVSLMLREFSYIYDIKDFYVNFCDKDICNTQAFSYYICMYWALKSSSAFQMYFSKELKIMNLSSILDNICPVSSIHYKYLNGEISSNELYDLYNGVDDEIGVIHHEVINLGSEGNKGYDDSLKDIARLIVDKTYVSLDYDDFFTIIGCGYLSMGYYNSDKESIKDLEELNKDLQDKLTECNNDLKDSKNLLKTKSKEIESLEKLINELKSKLDNDKYESKIKSLESTIDSMKIQISRLDSELKLKDDEIIRNKQLIRSQIKKLKSYSSSSLEQCEELEELNQDLDDIENLDVSDMVSKLKGYSIGVFGGIDCGNMINKFKDYGLDIVHIVEGDNFRIGDLDFAVILTSNMQHKTLRRLESQFNGIKVYYNGSNVENIIREIYNKSIE